MFVIGIKKALYGGNEIAWRYVGEKAGGYVWTTLVAAKEFNSIADAQHFWIDNMESLLADKNVRPDSAAIRHLAVETENSLPVVTKESLKVLKDKFSNSVTAIGQLFDVCRDPRILFGQSQAFREMVVSSLKKAVDEVASQPSGSFDVKGLKSVVEFNNGVDSFWQTGGFANKSERKAPDDKTVFKAKTDNGDSFSKKAHRDAFLNEFMNSLCDADDGSDEAMNLIKSLYDAILS